MIVVDFEEEELEIIGKKHQRIKPYKIGYSFEEEN